MTRTGLAARALVLESDPAPEWSGDSGQPGRREPGGDPAPGRELSARGQDAFSKASTLQLHDADAARGASSVRAVVDAHAEGREPYSAEHGGGVALRTWLDGSLQSIRTLDPPAKGVPVRAHTPLGALRAPASAGGGASQPLSGGTAAAHLREQLRLPLHKLSSPRKSPRRTPRHPGFGAPRAGLRETVQLSQVRGQPAGSARVRDVDPHAQAYSPSVVLAAAAQQPLAPKLYEASRDLPFPFIAAPAPDASRPLADQDLAVPIPGKGVAIVF